MKNKILVVCQHYYPENFQITEICEELVREGYQVTALVGLPNYPEGYIPDKYKKHRNRKETINGVNVIRCYEIARRHNIFFLALNYISFWISSVLRVTRIKDDFDLVLGYETSPITMIDAGRIFSEKNHVPFIVWCCDIWPEALKVYIKSEADPVFTLFKRISKKIYASADVVFCQSLSFADYLKRTHDITRTKYLPYFVEKSDTDSITIKNETVDFLFMGNIGKAQNLERVIDAFEINRELNFVFHIVGIGSDYECVKKYVREKRLCDKIIFYGRKTPEEADEFYKIADICVVSLKSDNETGNTLPTKVQGYMAAGKPVIGMISGSARQVITEARCGFCADGNDINAFADYIREFIINYDKYKDFGQNGYNYYMKNFTKDIVMKKLTDEIDMQINGVAE